MSNQYDTYTLKELKELLWEHGLVPKRWMLNYIKKAEALYLSNNLDTFKELPDSYLKVIKERCSKHRKKVYKSRKNRDKDFSTSLTKEEKFKLILNTAESLIFSEVIEVPEGFTSFFGSTRGKLAFVFKDVSGTEYMFTRSEVEKFSKSGLYVPRGILSVSRTKTSKPAKSANRLKDIFGN